MVRHRKESPSGSSKPWEAAIANVQAASRQLLLFTMLVGLVTAVESKSLRCFYFGNSLTGGTHVQWHDELALPRGDTWITGKHTIAGGTLWQHVEKLFPNYPAMDKPQPGNSLDARNSVEGGSWDIVTLQPHQFHLTGYANWLGREAGDMGEAGKLVKWIRKHQPTAQVYLYQPWATPSYEQSQEQPQWDLFNYEQFWLRPYANPAPAGDPHPTCVMRTQAYHQILLDTLNSIHRTLLGAQPLLQIPVGDVMLELDRRLRAGQFVAADGNPFLLERRVVVVNNESEKKMVDITTEQIRFTDISMFYQDFQHHNPGLARFFDAAVFYAVLFGKKPEGLDYREYNVFPSKLSDGSFDTESGYNWRSNDNRNFIAITPEVADALAEVIWSVVSTHPNTGLGTQTASMAPTFRIARGPEHSQPTVTAFLLSGRVLSPVYRVLGRRYGPARRAANWCIESAMVGARAHHMLPR